MCLMSMYVRMYYILCMCVCDGRVCVSLCCCWQYSARRCLLCQSQSRSALSSTSRPVSLYVRSWTSAHHIKSLYSNRHTSRETDRHTHRQTDRQTLTKTRLEDTCMLYKIEYVSVRTFLSKNRIRV